LNTISPNTKISIRVLVIGHLSYGMKIVTKCKILYKVVIIYRWKSLFQRPIH